MRRISVIRYRLVLAALATLFLVADVGAKEAQGYLPDGSIDMVAVLPPPPSKGDARDEAVRLIFRETRRFVGTPRYVMATRDVDGSPAALLADFSCAVGVALTPQSAPRIALVARQTLMSASGAIGRAKDAYKRLRPFKVDEGEICEPKAHFDSFDYPSGHATAGWTWALVLTQMAPDHAAAILARGRAFGESRVICGSHNQSAIEAGRMAAASTVAMVQSSPDFQSDLAAARTELQALRSSAPKPAMCEEEQRLIAQPAL